MSPLPNEGEVPSGILPVSLLVERLFSGGAYYPFSATFASTNQMSEYSWLAQRVEFSPAELMDAVPSDDPTYLQLPDDLPPRVGALAEEITAGHDEPYRKAKAIETFLSSNYEYAFGSPDSSGPPLGQDPVDWFLFDSREGTCGQFSSAFVILARSVGLPGAGCVRLGHWRVSRHADCVC